MLQHPTHQVKGLQLLDNSRITNQMFADDILLFLDGTPDNLDRALTVINKFGAASGAKLNLHKSVGLWLAHRDRTWSWGEEAGLKWLQTGEVTRYLGYPFGLQIPQKEKDGKMLSQIRKHLLKWSAHPLSLAGCIMISNQVILSSIWYLASCTDFTGKALKTARATVRNYIWSGKRESCARAKIKWDTAVLPIVRGGVKILDPQWQASALLVKQLIRGLSSGYEPWKVLVRYRVSQTKQSRRGRWPTHPNWIMNARNLVKQGSSLWQGIMKAWHTMQSGIKQQDPTCWAEIVRQPLFGNIFLTNTVGIQWGTDARSSMLRWMEKGLRSLKDIANTEGPGWLPFEQNQRLRPNSLTRAIYNRILQSILWDNIPPNSISPGQWVAPKEADGSIRRILHITNIDPLEATLYLKDKTERLTPVAQQHLCFGEELGEVRVVRCIGDKRVVLDFNPRTTTEAHSLWLWGNEWIKMMEWDPKDWQWRRIGILPETNILNYSTKRGYRTALKQNNHQIPVDAEMEMAGFNGKSRAKFFNRIWHPYLPRKVSAMQWLILTGGLPVGAWRERIGMSSQCPLCPSHDRETLQHAFQDCSEIARTWVLFRAVRQVAGLPASYHTWKDISRGLMSEPDGPSIEEDLRWDTASAITVNMHTPWDVLRAQLLWSIWCRRVELAFRDDQFHLGAKLWHAWRNTVYCAMEAYRELFRHKRNEEKKQELISCFQQVWTQGHIFGRLRNGEIHWNLTPHAAFLPEDLSAWNATPIRIQRLSPSPDLEAKFVVRPDFNRLVDDFLQEAVNDWQPAPNSAPNSPTRNQHFDVDPSESAGLSPSPSPRASRVCLQGDSVSLPAPVPLHREEASEISRGRSEMQDLDAQWVDPGLPSTSHGKQVELGQHLDKENLPPNIPRAKKTSRPKRRCPRALNHPSRLPIPLSKVPLVRSDGETKEHSPLGLVQPHRGRHVSRPKVKCLFGPRVKQQPSVRPPSLSTRRSTTIRRIRFHYLDSALKLSSQGLPIWPFFLPCLLLITSTSTE